MAIRRSRFIYRTATSLDGFIADRDNSLGWLFAADHGDEQAAQHQQFLDGVAVIVEGATTYEWVLGETNMLAEPDKWQIYYGSRPTFVFTSRRLPRPRGADVRFVTGAVLDALPAIQAAASDCDVWIVGGGDLAGQFFEADALDRVELSIAPVTLGAGAPLLPRRIESSRLRLRHASAEAQFLVAGYEVIEAAPD